MAPRVDPVRTTAALPAEVDVVVIGGGIVGAATALCLAERGVSVALCEKGRIAGEQSSRNWGWCRKMGRDLAEIPLAVESLRLWAAMTARTGAETGFRQTGIVYLCETAKEAARHEDWLARAASYQIDSCLIGADEIDRLLRGSARRWPAALYTPSDGGAEPEKATSAIANAAFAQGTAMFETCAVRGLETSAGRVSGVVTERGPIRCRQVVLAGGAWSRLFCGNLGVALPQLKLVASVMRTGPVAGAPDRIAGADDFAFRQRLDGGYSIARRNANVAPLTPDSFRLLFDFLPALITQWHELRLRVDRSFLEEWRIPRRWALDAETPFETVRTLDPAPSRSILDEGERNLVRSFPAFGRMQIAERWAGVVDATPDGVPVISGVPSLPGFYIASGFSGHGFGIGPGAGQLMADLVMGDTPIVDPTPYRYGRFGKA
ncbi:MAG: FAD-binding oxidoreductase [Methyloceanibacter sp.]|jgi:glycine/D-amino acid oxidase-like deaminating enzyme